MCINSTVEILYHKHPYLQYQGYNDVIWKYNHFSFMYSTLNISQTLKYLEIFSQPC